MRYQNKTRQLILDTLGWVLILLAAGSFSLLGV
jgi:hypothetical protein